MISDMHDLSSGSFGDRTTLWLIGCGAMGGALLARWRAAGLSDPCITVVDPAPANLPADFAGRVVGTCGEASAVAPAPDVVVLGVKPQMVGDVAQALRAALPGRFLLVSMLAGVRTTTLSSLLPAVRVARIMPNMPARVGQGITAAYLPVADGADRTLISAMLAPAGRTVWLDDEQRFDIVTALSGSGPAFLYRFVEALAGAGEAAGLDPETAALLARQTVVGAAALMEESGEAPAALRASVTSPNGTTQAGLDALDGDGALSALVRLTVRAAAERSRALASQADQAVGDAAPPSVREAARA